MPLGSSGGEVSMAQVRDWKGMKEMSIRLLRERTGQGLDKWNRRIADQAFRNPGSLRSWLEKQGVTGYAESLLVMETFGYPDFMMASADALVDAQYQDRPNLRPVYEAVVAAASAIGHIVVQARKTYVSLVTPRRTFARVQPTTKTRVDLGLRLEGVKPGGRLQPSRIHESMQVQIGLTSLDDVDSEGLDWIEKSYVQNR